MGAPRMSTRSGSASLQMGSALDMMRFKAIYRLTFKKMYAAVDAAGLTDVRAYVELL